MTDVAAKPRTRPQRLLALWLSVLLALLPLQAALAGGGMAHDDASHAGTAMASGAGGMAATADAADCCVTDHLCAAACCDSCGVCALALLASAPAALYPALAHQTARDLENRPKGPPQALFRPPRS